MAAADGSDDGLTWVGVQFEVVRTLGLKYLDDARLRFDQYISATLAASLRAGGRFNPRSEFGALYTASDISTAWEEVAARFAREGVVGLPPEMGLLGIIISEGRYADLTDDDACQLWDIEKEQLLSPEKNAHESCQRVARAIRVVADFIAAPSSRAAGINFPLFPDRIDSTLDMRFQFARPEQVPTHLLQTAEEEW